MLETHPLLNVFWDMGLSTTQLRICYFFAGYLSDWPSLRCEQQETRACFLGLTLSFLSDGLAPSELLANLCSSRMTLEHDVCSFLTRIGTWNHQTL